MIYNKKLVSLGLSCLMLAGAVVCAAQGSGWQNTVGQDVGDDSVSSSPNIIDDKYRTTYEVFVYSFCDSDGDGIGDLNGLIDKLDYINDGDDATDGDLRCNQIWLMPISPSPTYHKYDVVDYKDIDPQYGTLEDFDRLVEECHARGIRVIIDQVYNHSSSEHPWFTEAAEFLKQHDELRLEEAKEQCPFVDYYNFSDEKMDGFEPLSGTDYFYEARFWSGMPDLNLDSVAVRGEIADITGFWLGRGVDGFRLDAVTSYYTGEDEKNVEFMTWLNDTVKKVDSDAYIVAEAWTNSATYYKYYASGIDSFFDFDYSGSEGTIAGVARGTTPASRYAQALEKTEAAIEEAGGIDAPFYTNHDMARSAGYFTGKGSDDKVKLAGALNLLMRGNAFIYYGEELGMKGSGKDENKRAPMYWTEDGTAEGMCKGPDGMDSFTMKYPALDQQQEDPYSIYNYFKAAIRLRNTYPAIARGRTTAIDEISDSDISAFMRSVDADPEGRFEAQSLLLVINTSGEARAVDLSAMDKWQGSGIISSQLNTSEEQSVLEGDVLTVAPYGIVVIEN